MATLKIMGYDPALTHTGYAVATVDTETFEIVETLELGTVVTAPSKHKTVRKSSDKLARACAIVKALSEVAKRHDIKMGTSEIPSGAKSASAAFAFGVVTGILASLPFPLIEVTPSEVKIASAGSKIADKEDIVRWAVQKTIDTGDNVEWPTSKRVTDWGIKYRGKYVLKSTEHQADALAAIKAALATNEFRQLAGLMNSLI